MTLPVFICGLAGVACFWLAGNVNDDRRSGLLLLGGAILVSLAVLAWNAQPAPRTIKLDRQRVTIENRIERAHALFAVSHVRLP